MRVKITKIGILPGGENSFFASVGDDFYGHTEGYPKIGERYNVYGNVSIENIFTHISVYFSINMASNINEMNSNIVFIKNLTDEIFSIL